jgi:hypothetical protein
MHTHIYNSEEFRNFNVFVFYTNYENLPINPKLWVDSKVSSSFYTT